MKVEIDVELSEDIARKYEVIAVRTPAEGDLVIVHGKVTKFDIRAHNEDPRAILRRKQTPIDWWPQWILADSMEFRKDGVIYMSGNACAQVMHDAANVLDVSWIPEDVKRSGKVIKNPWKAEVDK